MQAKRSGLRWGLFLAIGLLYLASIPWYRAAEASPPLWLGLPSWVTVAIACYGVAACLNALAWWLTPLSDSLDEPTPPEDPSSEPGGTP